MGLCHGKVAVAVESSDRQQQQQSERDKQIEDEIKKDLTVLKAKVLLLGKNNI